MLEFSRIVHSLNDLPHNFQVVIGHITESAKANADSGSDKAVAEAEKAALERYKTVLQPYVRDSQSLQLTAVYALQVNPVVAETCIQFID